MFASKLRRRSLVASGAPRERALRPRRPRYAVLFGAALTIAGCLNFGQGLSGQGRWSYGCQDSKADPQCRSGVSLIPETVALGSRFNLTFKDRDGDVRRAVEPVSEDAVANVKSGFIPRRTGRIGFIATDDEEVAIDAIRIEVVAPHHLAVRALDLDVYPRGSRALPPDVVGVVDRMRFEAHAEDDRDKGLAGTMRVEWSTDDPEVATVNRLGDGSCVVEVVRPGQTVLRAEADTLRAAVSIVTTTSHGGWPREEEMEDAGSNDAALDAHIDPADADPVDGGLQ